VQGLRNALSELTGVDVKPTEKKRGPKPEALQIQGDWKEAMKVALDKKRPSTGWPKPTHEKRRKAE
jgi:hypothetical protein